MKTAILLFLLSISNTVLAYSQPKIEDPKTILDRWEEFLSFKDINLSLRTLNTVEMSHQFLTTAHFELKSDGWMNVSNKEFKNTLQLVWKFK